VGIKVSHLLDLLWRRKAARFLAGQADREKDCNAAKRKSVFPFIKPEKAGIVLQT
jgi:hypothetical protein